MNKVQVITGYIPLPMHPRSSEEYGKLGDKLRDVTAAPLRAIYEKLDNCWMVQAIAKQGRGIPRHEIGDNPAKNSLAYHCVQHQKFEWLQMSALRDEEPDVFVWMDYGICHVPGVTAAVINDYLKRVSEAPPLSAVYIPGCWNRTLHKQDVADYFPCWRFCGGLMAVPRQQVDRLASAVKYDVISRLIQNKPVTWEVNTLAHIEFNAKTRQIPIRWYYADHDQTMFNNFPEKANDPAL